MDNTATWLATKAAPGDVLMAGQEAVLHALTGSRAVPFPVSSDPDLLRDVLASHRVRYWMVLEDEPYPYFFPDERARLEIFEAAHPGLTRVVHRGDGYRIVEVQHVHTSDERR